VPENNSMGQIRYIFSDLDGTLLDSRKCVSQQTLALIAYLRVHHGVKFGIATGRDLSSVYPLIKRTGLDEITDAIVANNGVETVCCHTGECVQLPRVSREKIQEILRYYREIPEITVCFHNPDCLFTTRDTARAREIARRNHRTSMSNPLKEAAYEPTPRVMLVFDPADDQKVREIANAHPVAGLCLYHSEKGICEYLDARVSKARGVERYVGRYHHTLDHVLALGDSDNDADLLKRCAIGVAMKDGTEAVLCVADDVSAGTCDQEGVFQYLRDHLPLFET